MKTIRLAVLLWFALSSLPEVAHSQTHSPSISPEYFSALRDADARRLCDLLDHGASANARDARGDTPLMLAAVYADVPCMCLLLDRGAAVNVTNAAGATPLMRAACDYEKVRLLVERGADVNPRSAMGQTALMLAARPVNSHRAVRLLLSRGADARATNNWGATALMAAAAGGDLASVRALLKHGADVNAQPLADPTSFVFNGGRSALMWAAYRGDIEMMKALLEADADINGEGLLGTPLEQAAWNDHTAAARFLLSRGAQVNQMSHFDSYTALHWAASSEERNPALVKLLLAHGADPNRGGGDSVDAFMSIDQTPLMLARRRGETPIVAALLAAGATNETPDSVRDLKPPVRSLPNPLDAATIRSAICQALPLLQQSALESKQSFVQHESHQDCVSCHQQFLPLAAVSLARKAHVPVDADAERKLLDLVAEGEIRIPEMDWEALFHPEPAHTKGYLLFGFAAADLPANEFTDSWVHHLAVIQDADGRWCNNLPRPPIQSSDVGATALAIHALQHYPIPGRKKEFAERVDRARRWLWSVKPDYTDGRVYQILGLAWAGEPASRLRSLAKALLTEQRADGGWAQLRTLPSDAYATGQAIYALRVGARLPGADAALEHGRRFLLENQLEDGTWYVHRRTFPFQPTMKSGFPHGRDGWISATATSWAILALSLPETASGVASR